MKRAPKTDLCDEEPQKLTAVMKRAPKTGLCHEKGPITDFCYEKKDPKTDLCHEISIEENLNQFTMKR